MYKHELDDTVKACGLSRERVNNIKLKVVKYRTTPSLSKLVQAISDAADDKREAAFTSFFAYQTLGMAALLGTMELPEEEPYNHDADDVSEACGIPEERFEKMVDHLNLAIECITTPYVRASNFIEAIELVTKDKREAAFLALISSKQLQEREGKG